MAATSFYFDTRYERADGKYPVKVKISLPKRKGIMIYTDVLVKREQWRDNLVVSHPNAAVLNQYLRKRLAQIQDAIFAMTLSGEITRRTPQEIKNTIEKMMGRADDKPYTLLDHFAVFIDSKTNQRTQDIYRNTVLKIEAYDGSNPLFSDITFAWLRGFESFLFNQGLKVNAVNIHMRNIRAVVNDAINRDLAPLECYAFRKFKLKTEATAKRAITVEQLRQFRDHLCEPHQEQYRDMFMLIFYLGGINIIDLCHLKEINNGYIEYRRAKTKKLYKIKVEPEAQEIIDRYKGDNYLLNILDRYANYKDYAHRLNRNLREIGTLEIVKDKAGKLRKKQYTPLIPGISSYTARHTLATLASEIDIPIDTIAQILGHGGNTVTNIYIKPSQRKIDEAMRKVIDYVNSDMTK